MENRTGYILFVDDEKHVLDALQGQLGDSPLADRFILEFAQSGFELLDLIEELEEDGSGAVVVVSDQVMPGMRGDELLRRLHRQQPDLQTILLSGQADIEDVRRAFTEAGLFRFLEKPWDRSILIHTLDQAVSRYSEQQLVRLHQRLQRLHTKWHEAMSCVGDLRQLVEAAARLLHQVMGLKQLFFWQCPISQDDESIQVDRWTPRAGIQTLYWLDGQVPADLPLASLKQAWPSFKMGSKPDWISRYSCVFALGMPHEVMAVVYLELDPRQPTFDAPSLVDAWFRLLDHELVCLHQRNRFQQQNLTLEASAIRLRQAVEARNDQLQLVVQQTETHKRLVQPDWLALESEGFEVQFVVQSTPWQSSRFLWYTLTDERLFVLGGLAHGEAAVAAQLSLRVLLVLQHVEAPVLRDGTQLLGWLHRSLCNTRVGADVESMSLALVVFDRKSGALEVLTAGQRVWLLGHDPQPHSQPPGPSLPLDRPLDPLYVDHRAYSWSSAEHVVMVSHNLAGVLEGDAGQVPHRLRLLRQAAERQLKAGSEAESFFLGIRMPAPVILYQEITQG